MILLDIILNHVSPQFKNNVLAFIRSLKDDFSNSVNEWDQFSVKLLFTLFHIKD